MYLPNTGALEVRTPLDLSERGETRLYSPEVVKTISMLTDPGYFWRVKEVVGALIVGSFPEFFRFRPKWVETESLVDGEGRLIGFWLVEQDIVELLSPGEMAPLLFVDKRGVDYAIAELIELIERRQQEQERKGDLLLTEEEVARRVAHARQEGLTILPVGSDESTDEDGETMLPTVEFAILRGQWMDYYSMVREGGYIVIEMEAFPPALVGRILQQLECPGV